MAIPLPGSQFTVLEPEGVVVVLDTAIYRLAAIKKAAYKFGDRCHIHIELVDGAHAKVTLRGRKKLENVDYLAGDFCNEVLDQELREVVASETDPVRNLLLAQAFSRTSLIQPDFESADFRDDPCNIRPPDAQHPATS